jgi:hypothetical protein
VSRGYSTVHGSGSDFESHVSSATIVSDSEFKSSRGASKTISFGSGLEFWLVCQNCCVVPVCVCTCVYVQDILRKRVLQNRSNENAATAFGVSAVRGRGPRGIWHTYASKGAGRRGRNMYIYIYIYILYYIHTYIDSRNS